MNHLMLPSTLAGLLARTILLLGAFLSLPLKARTLSVDSIESLTCASQIVAVGTLREIISVKGPDGLVYKDYVMTVSEMIKGSHANEISFTRDDPRVQDWSWMKPDLPFLVFLHQHQDRFAEAPGSSQAQNHDFRETRVHNRLVPVSDYFFPSVLPLSDLPKYLYDKEKEKVSDSQTLLTLCRKWSASTLKNTIRWVQTDPSELSSFIPYALIVPAEEKHRLLFLQSSKSTDPILRRRAAEELWKFPGDESEAALRSLLNDTTESIWCHGHGEMARIEYSVRSAAYHSLKQLGKPVPDLPLQRLPTAEEKRLYRQKDWQQSFKEALQNGWTVADIHDGQVQNKDSRDWTFVEVDLTKGKDKCSLLLIPKPFDLQSGGKMKYLGSQDPSSSSSVRFYATPSIPSDLEQRLISYFGLTVQH
jgi:hypothetical protein